MRSWAKNPGYRANHTQGLCAPLKGGAKLCPLLSTKEKLEENKGDKLAGGERNAPGGSQLATCVKGQPQRGMLGNQFLYKGTLQWGDLAGALALCHRRLHIPAPESQHRLSHVLRQRDYISKNWDRSWLLHWEEDGGRAVIQNPP